MEEETNGGHQHEDEEGNCVSSLRTGAVPVIESMKGRSGRDGGRECYKMGLLQHQLVAITGG